MKKYIAIVLTFACLTLIFSACAKKPEGTDTVTIGNSSLAVVTKEGGGLDRDENGDVRVVVTDDKGNAVTDKDGNQETSVLDLTHAFVYDNRIEFEKYSLEIPKGWSNNLSYADLIITKDSTGEQIKIMRSEDKKFEDALKNTKDMFDAIGEINKDTNTNTSSLSIGGENCTLLECYTEGDETVYLAYAFLENQDALYTFMITADHNMSGKLDEVEQILNSVQFK